MWIHREIVLLAVCLFTCEIALLSMSYEDPQFTQGWSELTKTCLFSTNLNFTPPLQYMYYSYIFK